MQKGTEVNIFEKSREPLTPVDKGSLLNSKSIIKKVDSIKSENSSNRRVTFGNTPTHNSVQKKSVNVTDKVGEATIENDKIKENIKTESEIQKITTNDQNKDSNSKQVDNLEASSRHQNNSTPNVGISNDQFYSAKSEQSTRNNFETIQSRQNIKIEEAFTPADYIEDTEISELISLKSPLINDKDSFNFTNSELDFLKDLPNIQYTLSEQQIKYCYNGLLDILFAYCYDQRSTYFDGNIESGWTIVKLASTLSWLDAFETPKEALVTAFRRSVIYPLYRHFQLSQTVLQDLKDLISLDERYLIRILIQIYHIFLKGDCCRYILNNLFIRDYITYIMKWNKEQWKSTVQEVLATNVKKEDLGLNLQEIEDGFNLQEKFANIRINDGDDSDDNDDSSEDSSEDSSSSGSCSSDSETDSDDCSEPIEVLIQKKNSI
ncbi:hypothetical protein GWI33_003392 [Rhynchophorus ferrugineus]|uniref:Protein SHQ1 homolog n=1 Tax=Rhynchophorus ferrugineus TaxID=354439 RepID=A0A834MKZ6_RHYFE|nr:hypothetical protein GWI33_003392 [Rhynchophorus ferrugineus]